MSEPGLDASLWARTATPAPETPPLQGDRRTDVAIVGGGFTGLSAALHLAEADIRVTVLEAEAPGWGASGRNGGMVIPGLKYDPDELTARFGPARGERMIQTSAATADLVFALIERHGISCEACRAGWIQPAHTPTALEVLRRRQAQWAERGANVQWLDRTALAERTGTDTYYGGWIDLRGGSIQPLSFARGLAKAAISAGATVCGASPVTALTRGPDGWRLTTPTGELTAEHVILATNSYTDRLWPGLHQSVVPVYSVQIATAPLGENVRRSILPGGEVVSDTRRVLWYFRKDAEGRLLMGGGGSAYPDSIAQLAKGLRHRLRQLLPLVTEPEIAFAWGGRVALTRDHVPHLHELAPGLWAGRGYNGRGIGMAMAIGKQLAERVRGRSDPEVDFPTSPMRPYPLHALHRPVVTATRLYYRLRDCIER